jgi:hypothetical protein
MGIKDARYLAEIDDRDIAAGICVYKEQEGRPTESKGGL